MDDPSIELSFRIYYEDTETPIVFDSEGTIKDFKEFTCLCLNCNSSDIIIFLESFGQIDIEELLELPLSILELKSKNDHTYKLFYLNKTRIEQLIKYNSFCTQKIFSLDECLSNTSMSQYGLRLKNKENKIVCLACAKFCHQDVLSLLENFTEENFVCECSKISGNECTFDTCELTYIFGNEEENKSLKNEIIQKCKKALEECTSEFKGKIEKQKLEEIKQKTLLRDFNFEDSIKSNMKLILNYKDPDTQKKIKEIIPKRKENLTSKEYVKELLHWYKNEFFTWCNKPKCPLCNSDKDISGVGTYASNEEEKQYQSYRTEVYSCQGCGGNEVRFPRYNSPLKLLETKTGRCGEWANLFGAILFSCGFKTRFINNYEDHVWNEFYNEEEKRWIHIDSCEEAYDTPLVYEQGWGRVMTFIVATSDEEIVDVTPRYVKDWTIVKERRSDTMENSLKSVINQINNDLYKNLSEEEKDKLKERRIKEKEECDTKTGIVSEEEKLPRQSGSEEWKKERGEI